MKAYSTLILMGWKHYVSLHVKVSHHGTKSRIISQSVESRKARKCNEENKAKGEKQREKKKTNDEDPLSNLNGAQPNVVREAICRSSLSYVMVSRRCCFGARVCSCAPTVRASGQVTLVACQGSGGFGWAQPQEKHLAQKPLSHERPFSRLPLTRQLKIL